jgi:hypothetical protein
MNSQEHIDRLNFSNDRLAGCRFPSLEHLFSLGRDRKTSAQSR